MSREHEGLKNAVEEDGHGIIRRRSSQLATVVVLKLQPEENNIEEDRDRGPSSSLPNGSREEGEYPDPHLKINDNSSRQHGTRDEPSDSCGDGGDACMHGEEEEEEEEEEEDRGVLQTIGDLVSNSAQSVKDAVLGSPRTQNHDTSCTGKFSMENPPLLFKDPRSIPNSCLLFFFFDKQSGLYIIFCVLISLSFA